MSKKNKKKLNKMLRARALEQAQVQPTEAPAEDTPNVPDQTKPAIISQAPDETNEEAVRVKHEIRRILITMGMIIIIIVMVYLINQKTDWVLQAGKYLANALSINL